MATSTFNLQAFVNAGGLEKRPKKISVFKRMYDAMIESRRRQAELEIARHSGVLDCWCDETEQRMNHAMVRSGLPVLPAFALRQER